MVIRCERCSTMYELDESLLSPTGSEVQCTKCQHVFTAFPPRSAGRTLVGVPAAASAPASAPASAAAPATPPAAAPEPVSAPVPAAASAAPPTPSAPPAGARAEGPVSPVAAPGKADGAPRPVRTSAPAVYRPQASGGAGGSAPVSRAPVLKRDTVGTFEARLRASARWRWLAPLLLAGLVVVIAGAWALLGRRGEAGAERTREEALARLALDDSASVEDAVARLGAVVNKRPKLRAAAADRALALVVRAAVTAEEAEALAARTAEVRDDRERARREQGSGWQESERAAWAEASRLEPEVRAREEKTRALTSGARDQLAILQAEAGETPEVVRALALLHAFAGERDRLHRLLRVAREKGIRDPWIELADGWGDARDPDRAARERSLVKLGALAAARPEVLRGRYLLARAQLSLGRKAEALATSQGILTANPAHEGAKRLRDELSARPAVPASAQPAAAAPPPPVQAPPEKPAPLRRKAVAQPAPAASAAADAAPGTPAPATPREPPPSPAPAPEAAPAPEPSALAPAPAAAAPPPSPPPSPPPAPRRAPVTPEPASDGG